MQKIEKYELITERDTYLFNKKVNEFIKKGYQPKDPPQITTEYKDGYWNIVAFSQVMVVYKEDSK